MKNNLTFLLIPILLLAFLSCSRSKDNNMTSADQKSLSGNINVTDHSGLSFDGQQKLDQDKNKTGEEKTKQKKTNKRLGAGNIDVTDHSGLSFK